MSGTHTMRKGAVYAYGDRDDGVIGIPVVTDDGQTVEASYFYGTSRPKNIIVVSSQAGCPMRCSFCELGGDAFVRNLAAEEVRGQVALILEEAAALGFHLARQPHKLTVANTGEPLLNPALPDALALMPDRLSSFKVSTVLPAGPKPLQTLGRLAAFAASIDRPVQLQVSLISTSEERRREAAGARVAGFQEIRAAGERWRHEHPRGRKINLSLIVTHDMPCEAAGMPELFPPELFQFRFREYVPTRHGDALGLSRVPPERLERIKRAFQDAGYEVGDWGSPSPTEWRHGLAGNVIRRTYLDRLRPT